MPKLARTGVIVRSAIENYHPKVIVSLVSGGNDSLTAYYALREVGIKPDFIVHVYTGTGIPETREFVEGWAISVGIPLLICDAGDAYEKYVQRKGFFGRGVAAHAMAYHILKATPLRKKMSQIRQKRRHFPILMFTGIRLDESDNRKYNFAQNTIKPDPAAQNNIFVNHIEQWTGEDCRYFLEKVGAPKNPVAQALHRSAECMCGTMQTKEDRMIASAIYPAWGKRLDTLETEVKAKHGWGWCENKPKSLTQEENGQLPFINGFEMCRHCLLNEVKP